MNRLSSSPTLWFPLVAAAAACAPGPARLEPAPAPRPHVRSDAAAIEQARVDSIRRPYTEADIRFMTGMIAHHAQAIVMARMALANQASPAIRALAERVINAQEDEIVVMQQWLSDRRQPVPEPSATGAAITTHGVEHHVHMPGMLTAAQLAELEAARGRAFDRLFLTSMIQHHRGAVDMVKDLLASHGAAQDEIVFKLSADINVDQLTEIARMEQMLLAIMLEDH